MQFEEKIKQEVPQDDSTDIEEKMILYTEIKKRKPEVIVEIGTHRGLTTLYLAHAAWENGKGTIHTCDPNPEWYQQGNFAKFEEFRDIIKFYLVKGKDLPKDIAPIDFLFIDGWHEKELVLEELRELMPRLSPNAVVYFHDTLGTNDSCDPLGAAKEFGLEVELINTKNGMAIYEHNKTKNISNNTDNSTRGATSDEGKPVKARIPRVRVASGSKRVGKARPKRSI